MIGRVMRLGILVAVFATVGLSVAKAQAPRARQGLLSLENARLFDLQIELSAKTAQNGQDVGALLGQSLDTIDWWDRLGAIRTPTLVIQGRQDIAPVSMARALSEAFPNGSLALLDSGHFPYIEDPGGLTSAIAGFFVDIAR